MARRNQRVKVPKYINGLVESIEKDILDFAILYSTPASYGSPGQRERVDETLNLLRDKIRSAINIAGSWENSPALAALRVIEQRDVDGNPGQPHDQRGWWDAKTAVQAERWEVAEIARAALKESMKR